MKKNFLFFIVILISFISYGQNWETGGNPLSGGEFLGTTNNFDLSLRRNNFRRMQFQNEATWNGLNGMTATNASRIYCGLNNDIGTAWSIMHFWNGLLDPTMNRVWFNLGTS